MCYVVVQSRSLLQKAGGPMVRRVVSRDKVHRLFYPAVPVLVTGSLGNRVASMPAISCTTVSFSPLLISVAIHPDHTTHKIVEESGYFAVNWLNYAEAGKVAYMAEVSGKEVHDKITSSGLTVEPGRASPTVTIKEAVAVVECIVRHKYRVGDHDLFVGECLTAYADDDFEDYWLYQRYVPILYVGSERTIFGRKYVPLSR